MDRSVAAALADSMRDRRAGRLPDNGAIHRAIWQGAKSIVLSHWDNGDDADNGEILAYVVAQYRAIGTVRNWDDRSVNIWIASALDVLHAHCMYSGPSWWMGISSDILPERACRLVWPGQVAIKFR